MREDMEQPQDVVGAQEESGTGSGLVKELKDHLARHDKAIDITNHRLDTYYSDISDLRRRISLLESEVLESTGTVKLPRGNSLQNPSESSKTPVPPDSVIELLVDDLEEIAHKVDNVRNQLLRMQQNAQ